MISGSVCLKGQSVSNCSLGSLCHRVSCQNASRSQESLLSQREPFWGILEGTGSLWGRSTTPLHLGFGWLASSLRAQHGLFISWPRRLGGGSVTKRIRTLQRGGGVLVRFPGRFSNTFSPALTHCRGESLGGLEWTCVSYPHCYGVHILTLLTPECTLLYSFSICIWPICI